MATLEEYIDQPVRYERPVRAADVPFLRASIQEQIPGQEPVEYQAAIWPVRAEDSGRWKLGVMPVEEDRDQAFLLDRIDSEGVTTPEGVELALGEIEIPEEVAVDKQRGRRLTQLLKRAPAIHIFPQPSSTNSEGKLLIVSPEE